MNKPQKVENVPYISKIELKGFKSFGNSKITIPLSEGLTAIVGPNGHGKSNIFDALSFVLGEMSAKSMRARQLSDLIYWGDKNNGFRPAPFAEVALYFNNKDGKIPTNSEMVVISRQVKRSGDCVYKINNRRVNRQDIVDLLAPSMTSPGGYNFVMQGDVGKFVNMNPTDRRLIIDDLAGVAEYDEKKQKSVAELQKVEGNLNTAGVRLEEISDQMERLKIQMDTAIKYKQLMRELDEINATLILVKKKAHKKKLSKLKSKIEKLSKDIQRLRNKHRSIMNGINKHEEKIGKLDDIIEEKRSADVLERVRVARAQIGTLSELLDATSKKQSEISHRIAELTAQIRKKGKFEIIPGNVISLASKFKELYKKFNTLSISLNENKSLAVAEEILHKLRMVLDELNSIVDTISKRFHSLSRPHYELDQKAAADLRAELVGLERVRAELGEQISELQTRIKNAQSKLESASKLEKEIRLSIEKLRDEKNKLRAKVSKLAGKARILDGKVRELNNGLQEVLAQKASAEAELSVVKEEMKKINVEVKLPAQLDTKALERKVAEIEFEKNSLGEVNFSAIRDFREAEQRYNSEKVKYDKLMAERESLLNFMHNIDEKKKEVFMNTFSEISKHFREIFGQLSPRGTGELILENEESPFEGGVEIRANPQGKNTTVVSLSGGEKALTALALIFALQRYRPTTFYVLDEIDAHLDPQNRKRVAEMLRRFSRESQMVVITLHDAIMSAADRLFGVAMDKNKISRLLSVELSGFGG